MDGWMNRWTDRQRTVHRHGQKLAVNVHLLRVLCSLGFFVSNVDSCRGTGEN